MSLDYSIKKGAIMGTGNVTGMAEAIRSICDKGKDYYTEACRPRWIRLRSLFKIH